MDGKEMYLIDGLQAVCEGLRCTCGGVLGAGEDCPLRCSVCGTAYPVEDGIPLLIAQGAATALDQIDYDSVYRIDDNASMAFASSQLELLGARLGRPVDSFLEIGAGTGQFTLGFMHQARPARALVTDISPGMLMTCRGRLRANGIAGSDVGFAAWDGSTPLAPEAFDFIAGFSVLHHVLDYQAMITSLAPALRPGGVAVFLEPNYRFHLAMVETACEIFVAAQGSPEWQRDDLQHLADWTYENNTNLRFRGDERVLAAREDKHLFDGDQLREAGRLAGLDAVELLAAADESLSGMEVYSAQMNLSPRARDDLMARYARLLPGPFAHLGVEDLAASSTIVFGRMVGPATAARGAPPPQRLALPLENAKVRCDLAFCAADAEDDAGIRADGWILGDRDLAYVALRQGDREWLFPVSGVRMDVHSAINATREYPLRRALFSGVAATVNGPALSNEVRVLAVGTDGTRVELGTITPEGETMAARFAIL
jgi:SAM-dependent methyltransferase